MDKKGAGNALRGFLNLVTGGLTGSFTVLDPIIDRAKQRKKKIIYLCFSRYLSPCLLY
jgi:hypothetical protein